jgi:hypothetical protein
MEKMEVKNFVHLQLFYGYEIIGISKYFGSNNKKDVKIMKGKWITDVFASSHTYIFGQSHNFTKIIKQNNAPKAISMQITK